VSLDGSFVDTIPAFVLIGLGLGACAVAVQVVAFSGVESQETGLVSGLVNTAQQVGGVVGVAAIATFAATTSRDALTEVTTVEAIAQGLHVGFLIAAGVAGIAVLIAWRLLRPQKLMAAMVEVSPYGVTAVPIDNEMAVGR
jgi:sugar phosphate permease